MTAGFLSLPGFLIGLGVVDPDTAGFLPGANLLVGVVLVDVGVVLLDRGVLAVVVVLGADKGVLGLDGVVVLGVVFDRVLVAGLVVDLGVRVVAEVAGAVPGLDLGVVEVGVSGLVKVRWDRGTLGVVVVGLGVLGLRADVVLLSAAFLAADAALATLVRVADGALRGVFAPATSCCVLEVDTGVVLALDAAEVVDVDVFVIVLDVVAVDILVVGVVAGLDATLLVVADGVVLGVGVDEGLVGVVDVVGRAVLALKGCLGVVDAGVDLVDGLVGLVVDLAVGVVLEDRGVRFFASAGSGFFNGAFAFVVLVDDAILDTAAPVAATPAATAANTLDVSDVSSGFSLSIDFTSTVSGVSSVEISWAISGSVTSGSGADTGSGAIANSGVVSGSGANSGSLTIS